MKTEKEIKEELKSLQELKQRDMELSFDYKRIGNIEMADNYSRIVCSIMTRIEDLEWILS